MAFPALELAGLAGNVIGSVLQAQEARRRQKSLERAARRLATLQSAREGRAASEIKGARYAWENDPGRATLRQMWEQRLANPNVISAGDLSTLKQGALSEAGSESAGAINSLREQSQRSGLGGSRMALGAEAGLRGRAFGTAAKISSGLDITAAKANRQSQDAVRGDYAGYVSDENAQRASYAQRLADLYSSKQYSESDLLAQM